MKKLHHAFTVFAKWVARAAGHPLAFVLAASAIVIWAATGPMFAYNNTWQLVINTSTTIITFLMVFVIQNTQNRDSAALHIKLDELIRATRGAHNVLLDLEELEQRDIERLHEDYEELAARAREDLEAGKSDTEIRETKAQAIDAQNQKHRRRRKR